MKARRTDRSGALGDQHRYGVVIHAGNQIRGLDLERRRGGARVRTCTSAASRRTCLQALIHEIRVNYLGAIRLLSLSVGLLDRSNHKFLQCKITAVWRNSPSFRHESASCENPMSLRRKALRHQRIAQEKELVHRKARRGRDYHDNR